MPVLTQGAAVRSREPTLAVENKLDAGSWRFRLTVLDDAGNESAPAELVVRVQAPATPTGPVRPAVRPDAILRPADPVVVQPIRRPSG